MVMLDHRGFLAVWVVLGGLGRWWVVMLVCRVIWASVYGRFGFF